MHVVVTYTNIGGYHAARLRAAHEACLARGWRLTAVQVTDAGMEHPWGELRLDFPLRTLLRLSDVDASAARRAVSDVPARTVREALDDLSPDCLAIHGWGSSAARAALGWCRDRGVPAVVMSESKRDDQPRVWWKELLKSRRFVRRFDAALVAGAPHRDYIVELGIPPERVFFGHNAVDNEHFRRAAQRARDDLDAARARQPAMPRRPFFLAVTRMLPRKNVPMLVRAYAAYRARVGTTEAWDLAVCGSGADEAEVRRLIGELRLADCVALPGFVAYADIGDWYGCAAAFVHPAAQEQWGLVVNEACAAGLPIVCSRTVGARYHLVLEGENGLLFDPAYPDELAHALIAMHQLSAESRREMAAVGQRLVRAFAPEAFARGLMAAVHAAVARRLRHP